jgi:hypothetical protein
MSKLEVDKIDPQSGTDLEIGTSGDTVTIPSGVTLDASNATTSLPATVVTTDGTQTLTNKSIATTQLTGTITPSDNTVSLAKLTATGTKDATTFLRGDNTFAEAGGGVDGIVSSANATAITINSDEIVTLSSVPAFSAGLDSSATFSANTFYIFNDVTSTAHFNQGGHYSTVTGLFTAPVAGIYQFYCTMIWEGVSNGQAMHDAWRFRKNTTSLHYDSRRAEYVDGTTGNSGYYTTHQSAIIELAASDTFGVYVGSNSAAETVHGNTVFTYFQGYLIG